MDEEFIKLFNQVKELCPGDAYDEVKCIKKVMKEYIKRSKPKASSKPASVNTKSIPKAVKEYVYLRDGGQCTYVGKDGKRCSARLCLEYDHIHPKALGGSNDADNIRLMCSTHNKYLAEKVFGKRNLAG